MFFFLKQFTSKFFRSLISQHTNLNCRGIADESRGHFQAARRYIANGGFHVARYPFDEIAAIFILNVEHLLVHLLH